MAVPRRVIVVPDFDESARARLRAVSARLDLRFLTAAERLDIEELSDPDAEGFVGFLPPADHAGQLPALRWIQLQLAGVERLIPFDPWARGIVVTSAAGVFAVEMAEHVLWALLEVEKLGPLRRAHQAARTWPADNEGLVGRSLRGRTIVIVGYGGVGREIARVTSALGMRVLAVKARPGVRTDASWRVPGTGDPEGMIPEQIVGLDGLATVAPEADVLVLAISLTSRTRGLVGADVLDALPPRAVVVNIARGPIVDEEALVAALRGRRLRAAFLDVFATEPLPRDHPFWTLPGCVVTPHVSGGDAGAWEIFTGLVAENFRRFALGEPLLNLIDRARAVGE